MSIEDNLYLSKQNNTDYKLNKISENQSKLTTDLIMITSELKHIVELIAEIRSSSEKKDVHYINSLEKFGVRLEDSNNRNVSLELQIQRISSGFAQKFMYILTVMGCCGVAFMVFIQPHFNSIQNELAKHDEQIKSITLQMAKYER